MYRIYSIGADGLTPTHGTFGTEALAIVAAVNELAAEMSDYQKTGKKATLDIAYYNAMHVVRIVDAKDIFIRRLAIQQEN